MAENEFLASIGDYLVSRGSLNPAPATVGLSEPVSGAELPAIVLSLEDVVHPEGSSETDSQVCEGALPWEARIDLADPVLPDDPTFSLVSLDRLQLTLPHGGLIRRDAGCGPLGPHDLKVIVAGVERPVVTGTPFGDEASVDAWVGSLRFARPLPLSGEVVAGYFLGQAVRRVVRISGILRADTLARNADDARRLSTALIDALLDHDARLAVRRLQDIRVTGISSIGPQERDFANARRRTVRFAFDFELDVVQPDAPFAKVVRLPGVESASFLETAAEDPGDDTRLELPYEIPLEIDDELSAISMLERPGGERRRRSVMGERASAERASAERSAATRDPTFVLNWFEGGGLGEER